MQVITDSEVLKWFEKIKGSYGIHAEGTNLYYTNPEANSMELTFPERPLRVTYFARMASMLGIQDESLFYGALLWITEAGAGSLQLEKSGWRIVEKMRQGFGENRSLQTACGHLFRADELVDLTAFLVPCFVFAWDAYVVPNGDNDFFIHIDHDEYWGVITRTKEAFERLRLELSDIGPKESPKMRDRFCRQAKS
jgi:hypothetical protein